MCDLRTWKRPDLQPQLDTLAKIKWDRFTGIFLDIEPYSQFGESPFQYPGAGKKYASKPDKVMRMNSVTSTIENGFVHIPEKAAWLPEYLHELATFPKGTYDDQVDSTSQALDWFKQQSMRQELGLIDYEKQEVEKLRPGKGPSSDSPLINRGALLREWDRRRWPFRRF